MIADQVNTPVFIVHVMCKGAADAIVKARKEGKRVFGEPIAAGLGTDNTKCWDCDWRVAAGWNLLLFFYSGSKLIHYFQLMSWALL